jgi:hypothetical protein
MRADGTGAHQLLHSNDAQSGWLAFDSKRKADPGSNIAVLKQNSQTPKLLTHETDPQYTWRVAFWSPDEKYVYATRLRVSG